LIHHSLAPQFSDTFWVSIFYELEVRSRTPPLKSVKDGAAATRYRNCVLIYRRGIIRSRGTVKRKRKAGPPAITAQAFS
jgi:hypothetical protein